MYQLLENSTDRCLVAERNQKGQSIGLEKGTFLDGINDIAHTPQSKEKTSHHAKRNQEYLVIIYHSSTHVVRHQP